MATTRSILFCACLLGFALAGRAADVEQAAATQEMVRVRAVADVGLADGTPRERNSSAGKAPQLKLRNIQDLAIVRFDGKPLQGRQVLEANLFLHRAGADKLRYVRVSTVNQDWQEGEGQGPTGPASGATFMLADAAPGVNRRWAWPGSSVADVIMSSGNSLACWAERKELEGGWMSVAVAPEMIYALAVGDSDGLAVMDGGNPANQASVVSSAQVKGFEPYLEVRLGPALTAVPAEPAVTVEPAPERAPLREGAIRVRIEPAQDVFCWRLELDGQPIERWRVKHPLPDGPAVFCLEDLGPGREYRLDVVAVSPGGQVSPAVRLKARSSRPMPRNVTLGTIDRLRPVPAAPREAGPLRVWPLPGLVKVHPETGQVTCDDLGTDVPADASPQEVANAVWDGTQVRLFGARNETVSFQLCLENLGDVPLTGIRVRAQPLLGPGKAKIAAGDVELYQNWYARSRLGQWQPAYCVPLGPDTPLAIPQVEGRIPQQRNQTVYVDVYVPKQAMPGTYVGSLVVTAEENVELEVPVSVEVLGLALPDRLAFWPELNAFRIPARAMEHYRLAQQHRCVLNCWAWRPKLVGSGRDVRVEWEQYDRRVGPLLTGEAFAMSRRGPVPVECMYLPFEESWPTPLDRQSYRYEGYWAKQGDDPGHVAEHYRTAPPIAQGFTQAYRDAFQAVQRQFIEHFREKGYTQTEMQCYFGNKAAHRVLYGVNTWWTTDEPYYWDDWMAVQFFLQLWATGRGTADPRLWAGRADISRPQWQGRVLGGLVDAAYYGAGGFTDGAMVRRCRTLGLETGLNVRAYGSASHDSAGNTENVVLILSAWADGADAFLPWQTLGSDESLDQNDAGCAGGSALLVPGDRFDLAVVGDMRLKALRDGQQLIEYLTLLAERKHLSRQQIKAMIHEATRPRREPGRAAPVDDADTIELAALSARHLSELRRRVAGLLVR